MMGKLTHYPHYKDTGVRWLGEIPAHWDLTRISSVTVLRKEQVSADSLNGLSVWHYSIPNVQETGDAVLEDGAEIDSNKFRILGDEILVSKLNPRKQTVALTQASNGPAVCSTEFVCLKPRVHVDQKFIFYTFLSENVRQYLDSSVESVTRSHQRVNPEVIYKMLFAYPPMEEQKSLSSFLDHETAKIDRLIARQERLIELLKEKRQAVISHAVTKGLNPDAPMKDSGVEWLGEVPAHWEASRLKYLVPGVTVGIVINPSSHYQETGVPCLRSLNISSGYIVSDQLVYISEESNEQLAKSKIYAGDVVVVRTGQAGTAAIVTKEFDGANCIDLLIVRKSKRILSEFLYHVIGSDRSTAQVKAFTVGAIQGHFNTSTLAELWLTCPPIEEQVEILKRLGNKLAAFDLLLEKARQSVALLQEHRTALISATVTGKIDVRGWQQPNTELQEAATAASA